MRERVEHWVQMCEKMEMNWEPLTGSIQKSAWEEVKEVAAEEEREVDEDEDEDEVKEYEVEEQTKRGPNQG